HSLRLAQRNASQGQLAILNLPKIEQNGSVGMFWRKKETPSLALSRVFFFFYQF
ncbi:LysR family transcriptional regulator, partial [Salmonella enterica subsp. enterica serovar Infantis]